ncbi:MAG: sodium:solute symporter [Acidobacteria bacterium]|nr:sodium:solute symporter [Acidobacteriota bacterium]
MNPTPALNGLDWLTIVVYFGVLLGVAWWVITRSKDTAADYFLAGRHLGWGIVGASIFASNIGSEHVVGLAGSGATDGVALAHYELHAWCLLVLGWVMVPFYMRSMVFTMPEFLEKRFSPAARYVLTVVSLISFVVSKIAVGIFAGGVVFSTLMPELQVAIGPLHLDSFWTGSLLVIVLTGVYTMLGGMRAVAYNDAVQVVIIVIGSAALTFYGLDRLGGWQALRDALPSEMFNLWKPLVPPGVDGTWAPVIETDAGGRLLRQAWYFNGNFPWVGMLFCAPIIGLWYWCTDQYIVQRVLGAPNEQVARRGTIFGAFLKLLPVYLFIVPGLVGFALAKTGTVPELASMVGPDGQPVRSVAQAAFPMMVESVLPMGLRGLVIAGLLSALMSSLAGVFNASATLFTVDLYSKWRPRATQHQMVRVGRLATIGMVIIGIAWIPVIRGASGLYNYLQAVQGYLAPPIFVVFFLGILWKRMNAQGCLAALVVGFVIGLFRMLVDTPITLGLPGYAGGYPEGSWLWIVNNIYFQYWSVLITVISAVVMIGVSLATAAPHDAKLEGLTFETVSARERRESRASWDWRDVATSAIVLACIAGAYLYFTG